MASARTWDIFCTVVDNYGDIGVCWRLARQLAAEHGVQVRLWVDDLASFRRICPEIVAGCEVQQRLGVEVRWWRDAFADVIPADVVVEAFACNPPASYVRAMAARQTKPAWINLEFLSAENWVEGCHAKPSPHPSLPLLKHFFFPGFGAGTGGLLAERGLAQARSRFQRSAADQAQFWAALGVGAAQPGALQVSLFCYANAAIPGLLRAWAQGSAPVRCLVPEGVAQDALSAFFGGAKPEPGTVLRAGNLEIGVFAFLDQDRYDRLLWTCHVNFVRGEDSFARAQWAARPLCWHIYPQQEDAHWPKLRAFLDLYCRGMPEAAAAATRRLWEAWNRGDAAGVEAAWPAFLECRLESGAHALDWARKLEAAGDLAGNLVRFCDNLLE